MSDAKQLIDAYIDGTLDDAGFAALCGWLREDEQHRHEFTRTLSLHSGIADWVSDRSGGLLMPEFVGEDDAAAQEVDSGGLSLLEALAYLDDGHDEVEPIDFTQELARRNRETRELVFRTRRAAETDQQESASPTQREIVIPKAVVWLGLAAVVGLALWLGWPASPPVVENESVAEAPLQPGPPPRIVDAPISGPTPVATLLQTSGVVWGETMPRGQSAQATRVGARLLPGGYTLEAGVIKLVFDQGAAVILEGPARFELLDDNAGRLDQGQLVALVPESAHGFRITTPAAEIIDLGTEFGVRVVDASQTEALVFDGEIAAAIINPSGSVGVPTHLLRDQAASLSRDDIEINREGAVLPGRRFARNWKSALRPVDISDGVRFIYDSPRSLTDGDLVLDNEVALIPEAMGIILTADLAIDHLVRSRERLTVNEWLAGRASIPAGSRVDAYLLHINRASVHTDVVRRSGSITFSMPIIGLAFDKQTLFSTDAIVGLPETAYEPINSARGMVGEGPEYPDRIVISEDRLTIEFDIAVARMDEMRILVESPEPNAEADRLD